MNCELSELRLNLITIVAIGGGQQWTRKLLKLPKLQSVVVVKDDHLLLPLCIPQSFPNTLSVEIYGIKFDKLEEDSGGLFEEFLTVGGHRLRVLHVIVSKTLPRLIDILTNAKNLRLNMCFIIVNGDEVTFEHLAAMYDIPVRHYLALSTTNLAHTTNK